jgi:hypothetical protein
MFEASRSWGEPPSLFERKRKEIRSGKIPGSPIERLGRSLPRSLIEAAHQKSGAFIHPFFELLVLLQQQRQRVGDIPKVNY